MEHIKWAKIKTYHKSYFFIFSTIITIIYIYIYIYYEYLVIIQLINDDIFYRKDLRNSSAISFLVYYDLTSLLWDILSWILLIAMFIGPLKALVAQRFAVYEEGRWVNIAARFSWYDKLDNILVRGGWRLHTQNDDVSCSLPYLFEQRHLDLLHLITISCKVRKSVEQENKFSKKYF